MFDYVRIKAHFNTGSLLVKGSGRGIPSTASYCGTLSPCRARRSRSESQIIWSVLYFSIDFGLDPDVSPLAQMQTIKSPELTAPNENIS